MYMKIYVAASFAYADRDKTEERKQIIEQVVEKVYNILPDSEFYLPHKLTIENAWDITLYEWSQKVFEADINALNDADLVLFISFGKENNAGAVWEVGYAYGMNIPTIVIKMTNGPESLMIVHSVDAIIKYKDIDSYDWINRPNEFNELDKIS